MNNERELKGLTLREHFKRLRSDKNHHLGLGDIRLTIAQQDAICDLIETKPDKITGEV